MFEEDENQASAESCGNEDYSPKSLAGRGEKKYSKSFIKISENFEGSIKVLE